MPILSRFASSRTPRRQRAEPAHLSANASQRNRPLPRELADAPDWLLDDIGLIDATAQPAVAANRPAWPYLVRRLG
jgi:hypothetical protein